MRKLLAVLASTIQMPKLQDKLKKEKIHSHFHNEGCILILQTNVYSNNNISILSEIQVILVISSNIDSNAIFIHTDFHTRYAIGLYIITSELKLFANNELSNDSNPLKPHLQNVTVFQFYQYI